MRLLPAVSLLLTLAVSAALLVIPTYGTSSESVDASGPAFARRTVTEGHATLLEVNGPRVLLPLGFPVLVALVPLLLPLRALRIAAAVLLGGFCFLGALSVGLFYVPSAIAMVIAAAWPMPRSNRRMANV